MESLSLLLGGFESALSWSNLLYCFIGVSIGMFVGVLPGIGPVSTTALLIPLTFGMDPIPAIIMLSGVYYGSMYGGTITAVLINVPGEAASIVTCLDGYEMAKQGRAGTALGVSAIGSFIGGIVAVIGLTFLGPPLAKLALKFGPPEFFALLLFGLLMVLALMGNSIVKGLISAFAGLILSLIGIDPLSGVVRFDFGQMQLLDGLDFIVLGIGLFGISEILSSLENQMEYREPPKIQGLLPKKGEWAPTLKSVARGTGIGVVLGLMPGANTIVSSLLSYVFEKKIAKDPSRFGKGAIEGVAGPETANNAHSGAANIPLFALGIPSSPGIAVLLGGFIIHGLTPGPALFEKHPDFVWAVIASMFIGNVMLLIFNLPLAKVWAKMALIPYKLLYPIVLIVILVGVYSVSGDLWDVYMMVIFGVIGYLMKKIDIPLAPIILTFILGKQIEMSLIQSLTLSENGIMILFRRPISATLITLAIIAVVVSLFSGIKKKKSYLASDLEL